MVVRHKQVFSSHVQSVGYDDASGELHVVYANGRTAVYEGVPPQTAARVQGSVSIGAALHGEIRGRFSHRYLEG